jgi:hypothetical protein
VVEAEEGGLAREMVLERARMARDSRSFCCWERPRLYHAWAFEGSERTAASAWRTVYRSVICPSVRAEEGRKGGKEGERGSIGLSP